MPTTGVKPGPWKRTGEAYQLLGLTPEQAARALERSHKVRQVLDRLGARMAGAQLGHQTEQIEGMFAEAHRELKGMTNLTGPNVDLEILIMQLEALRWWREHPGQASCALTHVQKITEDKFSSLINGAADLGGGSDRRTQLTSIPALLCALNVLEPALNCDAGTLVRAWDRPSVLDNQIMTRNGQFKAVANSQANQEVLNWTLHFDHLMGFGAPLCTDLWLRQAPKVSLPGDVTALRITARWPHADERILPLGFRTDPLPNEARRVLIEVRHPLAQKLGLFEQVRPLRLAEPLASGQQATVWNALREQLEWLDISPERTSRASSWNETLRSLAGTEWRASVWVQAANERPLSSVPSWNQASDSEGEQASFISESTSLLQWLTGELAGWSPAWSQDEAAQSEFQERSKNSNRMVRHSRINPLDWSLGWRQITAATRWAAGMDDWVARANERHHPHCAPDFTVACARWDVASRGFWEARNQFATRPMSYQRLSLKAEDLLNALEAQETP